LDTGFSATDDICSTYVNGESEGSMSTPRAWASRTAGSVDDGSVLVEPSPGVVDEFVLDRLGVRVVFGNGTADGLSDEVRRLGIDGLVVVCTPTLGRRATKLSRAVAHPSGVPILRIGSGSDADRDADVARLVSAATDAQGLLAVGGGSAITVARHAAGVTGLPVIAVPTTYAGREMTQENTTPTTALDDAIAPLPVTIVYDPILTTTLSQHVTAVSALAAIGRAALALCTGGGNPLAELTAGLAIRYLAEGAHDAVLHPRGLVGRSRALYGAHLVGLLSTGTYRGTVEDTDRVDDALAQAAGVHRSDVAGVLLAHRLEAAGRRRPLALAAVAAALRRDDAVTGVLELAADLGVPTSFAQLEVEPARMAGIRHAAQRLEVPQAERQALRQALKGLPPLRNRATTERGEHP
jgi:maleylacetate reductase